METDEVMVDDGPLPSPATLAEEEGPPLEDAMAPPRVRIRGVLCQGRLPLSREVPRRRWLQLLLFRRRFPSTHPPHGLAGELFG